MLIVFSLTAQDSVMVYTLDDVSVIDFKVDHEDVFKNIELNLNSQAIGIENGLEYALKTTVPVYFKNYSYGGITSIDFRGTGAERTKVYWNGIPVNSPSLGSFDFSLIPSFLISDAKVRFGGASLVDGGGGIGGSIQLNQNQNFTSNHVQIIGSIGSFGNYTGAVLAQFKVKKFRSDTRIYYNQAKNDYSYINTYKKDLPKEKRENNDLWRIAMQQSFNYEFNALNSIDLNFLYSKLERDIPSPISSNGSGSSQDDQLLFVQLGYNTVFKNDMFLKVRTSYQNQLNDFYEGNINASNRVNAWNNKLDWGAVFSRKFKMNASLRYDLYNVNTYGTGEIQEQQYSAFVAADWKIVNAFTLSLGIREEGLDNVLSLPMPYLGFVALLPKNGGSFKTSISRVFRYPTINERYWEPGGNPDLKPENGWNYELSYLNSFTHKKLTFDFEITGFYGVVQDWILWYPSAESSSIWQAQNLWKVNNSGLEFISGIDWKVSSNTNVSLKFLYTFNSSHVVEAEENSSTYTGNQLILVPKHMLFIPLTYRYKSFSGGIDYTYTGIRYTDNKNENTLDAYSILNLMLNYNFSESKLDLSLGVYNILNQAYQTYPGQPMPGINFNIQLKWQII